jgi:hypothetical protein
MSPAHQSSGNPCATNLVFFPELTPLSGADDGNTRVTLCQVARENGVIAKGRQIDGFTAGSLVNHLGARRGNQDEGPVRIVAIGELGRTILDFEDNLRCTSGFTGEKGIVEFLRNREGRFHCRCWKATAPGRRSRDSRGSGTNHIHGYDRPSRTVPAHAFQGTIDDDRLRHGAPFNRARG